LNVQRARTTVAGRRSKRKFWILFVSHSQLSADRLRRPAQEKYIRG
jgi:hypothetical protein